MRAVGEPAGVTATVNYVSPTSLCNRLYVAPGGHRTTTRYDPRPVRIADARPWRRELTLDEAGFSLLEHESAVADLDDDEAIEAVYVPEACEVVRAHTAADLVVACGWVRRRAAADTRGAQPPAADVHVDVHPDRAPRRFAQVYAEAAPDGPPFTRAIFTSFWRCVSPPPQDWPLALCDARSVADEEGVPNLMLNVTTLPTGEPEEIEHPEVLPAASVFAYRPSHRWWYFPDLRRDEALLIKLHDSDHRVAWRAPHTAFFDPTVQPSAPRTSLELRTMAFFTA